MTVVQGPPPLSNLPCLGWGAIGSFTSIQAEVVESKGLEPGAWRSDARSLMIGDTSGPGGHYIRIAPKLGWSA